MQRSDVKAARRGAGRGDGPGSSASARIALVGGLGFENAYALAMRANAPKRSASRTIADLARHAAHAVDRRRLRVLRPAGMGGAPQGLRPRRSASSGRCSRSSCMPAAASGEADVIAAYTSDGRIAQHDLVVLEDPKHAIPPYDAILLVSPRRANDTALLAALRPLVGAIDVTLMREANLRASRGDVARARRRAGCGARSRAGQKDRSLTSRPRLNPRRESGLARCAGSSAASARDAEIRLGVGPHRGRRPAGAARQRAERFAANTCSCSRCGWSRRRGNRCTRRSHLQALPLEARQMHLDARALAIEEGVMLEACRGRILAPSSRLMRASRLRLNAAVTPGASL